MITVTQAFFFTIAIVIALACIAGIINTIWPDFFFDLFIKPTKEEVEEEKEYIKQQEQLMLDPGPVIKDWWEVEPVIVSATYKRRVYYFYFLRPQPDIYSFTDKQLVGILNQAKDHIADFRSLDSYYDLCEDDLFAHELRQTHDCIFQIEQELKRRQS